MLRTHTSREYERLEGRLAAMGRWLDEPDATLLGTVPEVSRWSPAQHLYHVSAVNEQVFTGVLDLLDRPDAPPSARANIAGWIILTLGRIPRGRGQAPERFVPPDDLDHDALADQVTRARMAFERLSGRQPQLQQAAHRMPHPIFGPLRPRQWMRFARIHTDHHLTIVRDIVANG